MYQSRWVMRNRQYKAKFMQGRMKLVMQLSSMFGNKKYQYHITRSISETVIFIRSQIEPLTIPTFGRFAITPFDFSDIDVGSECKLVSEVILHDQGEFINDINKVEDYLYDHESDYGMEFDKISIIESNVKNIHAVSMATFTVLMWGVVTDLKKFRKSIRSGIGKRRIFGHGLLKIANNPANDVYPDKEREFDA